jgi:hypothetical protein
MSRLALALAALLLLVGCVDKRAPLTQASGICAPDMSMVVGTVAATGVGAAGCDDNRAR